MIFIQLLARGQRCILPSSFNHPLILHCRQCLDSAVGSICLQKSPLLVLDFYDCLSIQYSCILDFSIIEKLGFSGSRWWRSLYLLVKLDENLDEHWQYFREIHMVFWNDCKLKLTPPPDELPTMNNAGVDNQYNGRVGCMKASILQYFP